VVLQEQNRELSAAVQRLWAEANGTDDEPPPVHDILFDLGIGKGGEQREKPKPTDTKEEQGENPKPTDTKEEQLENPQPIILDELGVGYLMEENMGTIQGPSLGDIHFPYFSNGSFC
jgi:hypothetical protein